MPRRNHPKRRPKFRRLEPDQAVPRRIRAAGPPPALQNLTMPAGKCYYRSKWGKLTFKTRDDAERALAQAAAKRKGQANGHVECRYYPCDEQKGRPGHPGPDGCGGFHLTSRQTYEERPA